MKKPLFLLILLTIAFSFSCKKRFPDGPLISFRTVKHRILGNWKVNKYTINGVDSTAEFIQKCGCELQFSEGYVVPGAYNGPCIFNLINCNNGKTLSGEWYFPDDTYEGRQKLMFLYFQDTTLSSAFGTFFQAFYGTWHILRLTEKEFNFEVSGSGPGIGIGWSSTQPNGTPYDINLVKQ
jgi:hypothetical protein